jgi:hypothetical protein
MAKTGRPKGTVKGNTTIYLSFNAETDRFINEEHEKFNKKNDLSITKSEYVRMMIMKGIKK